MARAGLEPARLSAQVPKTWVSAYSTTPACCSTYGQVYRPDRREYRLGRPARPTIRSAATRREKALRKLVGFSSSGADLIRQLEDDLVGHLQLGLQALAFLDEFPAEVGFQRRVDAVQFLIEDLTVIERLRQFPGIGTINGLEIPVAVVGELFDRDIVDDVIDGRAADLLRHAFGGDPVACVLGFEFEFQATPGFRNLM